MTFRYSSPFSSWSWRHLRRNPYRRKKRQKKSIFIYGTTFKKNESGRDFQRGQIWNDRSQKPKKNYGIHPVPKIFGRILPKLVLAAKDFVSGMNSTSSACANCQKWFWLPKIFFGNVAANFEKVGNVNVFSSDNCFSLCSRPRHQNMCHHKKQAKCKPPLPHIRHNTPHNINTSHPSPRASP